MSGNDALPPLFAATSDADESAPYAAVRDHGTKQGVRREIEEAWRAFGHLIPEDPEQFASEFRRDFHARSWELYVLRWLAGSGSQVIKAPGTGPDFCAVHPRLGRFWVECVVPDIGEKKNKVWQRTVERTWSGPPDEPIQLRYTNSIQFKIKKIAEYRRRGLLGANEPVLIAMNQGAILDSDLNDVELPLAFSVLFGIGKTMLLVEIGTGEAEIVVQPQPTITNANGSEVSSAIFTEAPSSVVSGLILARHSTLDLFDNPGPFLTLAHNPLAQAPLRVHALPLRGELWVEDGRLVHRGVVSSHGRYSESSERLPASVGA